MSKRQGELAGMERPKVAAVEDAADEFVDASEGAKRAKAKKDEAAETLIAAMKAAKLSAYRFDGKLVTLSAKAKVTVKDADEEDDHEDQ